MSSIDDVCQEVLRKVDDALGFAVVDLDSGLLLAAAHNVPYFTQSYLIWPPRRRSTCSGAGP